MKKVKKFSREMLEDFIVIKNTKLFKLCLILMAFIFPLFIEKYHYTDSAFSFIRYVLFSTILLFLFSNLIFDVKKMWNYIYKKRYIIGIATFSILVACSFHGSSITIFNGMIEPKYDIKTADRIIGKDRYIRSDEWDISSLMVLSQVSKKNDLGIINKTMMGGIKSNVEMFPKLPTRSLSVLLSPRCIGFLFLPVNNAFSFYWFFEYFILFFASFEFLMILTNKNKFYSLVGAIMILFSSAVQWWEFTNIIAYGMLAIVLFDKFLHSEKWQHKVILAVLIGYSGVLYIMSLYPAWMIPFGYFFLGIVIWQLINNRSAYKWKDFAILLPIVIAVIAIMLVPTFLRAHAVFELESNTAYPGARFSTGGTDAEKLFYYIVSIFLPFVNCENASETAQFMGLYPLPLIMGIYYIIKNRKKKKKDWLIYILVFLILFLSLWNYIEVPKIFAKITFLYMSISSRTVTTVGYTSSILLLVILSNYSRKDGNKKNMLINLTVSLLILIPIIVLIHKYCPYMAKKYLIIAFIVFLFTFYLFIDNTKKSKKKLSAILIIISLISGGFVHPLSRTVDVIYNKPIAKKIRNIAKRDPDALWVSEYVQASNYVHANGVKTLNSTNYYPNYNLWKKIDKNKKNEELWNRYSTLSINIIEEKTHVKLWGSDHLALNINSNDLCKINVDYLFTPSNDRDKLSNDNIKISKIYSKDNLYIYKIKCT